MALGRSNSLSINTGQTNSLFSQQNNTSNPPPAPGGLFGSTPASNVARPQTGTSLFGNPPPTAQQPQSLFGNANTTAAKPTTSLFGNLNQTTQKPPQQTTGSSLFGNTNTTAQPQASTMFGNSTANPAPSAFGGQANAQPNPQSSIFGLSASQPPSLLNASQYRSNQYTPFAGKLTMGQQTQAPATQSAVKINFDAMRSTTRFGDCIEDIQKQLEAVDNMILAQERYCREIEAFLPKHGEDVKSIVPDVALISERAEAVENALSMDAQNVAARRGTLEHDAKDFERCQRVAENLRMPAQFRMPSVGYGAVAQKPTSTAGEDTTYDMDLIGNFFNPRTAELQKTLQAYSSNLTEIEAHLRVIETSAVGQAQQLAARRAGMGNGMQAQTNIDDNVRDLADTLRAFEGSILGAASLVGECREGVNELVLGKLSNGSNAPSHGHLRPV